jgi:hypothetical protein
MTEHFNFWEQMKLHTGNLDAGVSERKDPIEFPSMGLSSVNENGLSIQFIPSKRKKTRKVTMVIEGDFTISNVDLVSKYNDYLLQNFDHLDVMVKNIEKMDLCAIQCLYKMRSIYLANNKVITLESELPTEIRDLVSSTGLLPLITKPSLTA